MHIAHSNIDKPEVKAKKRVPLYKNEAFIQAFVKQFTLEMNEKIRKSNIVSRLREYVRDPSEAAQSESILPSCKAQLGNLEFKPLGGFIYLVLGNRLEYFIANESAIRAIIDADNSLCQKYYHYAFVTWENC